MAFLVVLRGLDPLFQIVRSLSRHVDTRSSPTYSDRVRSDLLVIT